MSYHTEEQTTIDEALLPYLRYSTFQLCLVYVYGIYVVTVIVFIVFCFCNPLENHIISKFLQMFFLIRKRLYAIEIDFKICENHDVSICSTTKYGGTFIGFLLQVRYEDAGTYTCLAVDGFGYTFTQNATLTVEGKYCHSGLIQFTYLCKNVKLSITH